MSIEVTDASFQEEVLERSRQLPVVVDFWAEWCGPCRVLGPVLEREAAAREGKVVLAKLDVDANPGLAARFQVQGIPAVKAFRDAEVAAEFVGAQPPAEVERFFDSLAPSPAEELVRSGDEGSLRKALELEPGRADAAVPLARLLHEGGRSEEALSVLEPVSGSFEADGLAARIRLGQDKTEPELAEALELLDRGEREAAISGLISALEGAGDGRREEIRRVVVGSLAELGQDDPVARRHRRRLAAALY